MRERTPEPVELPDHEHVTRPQIGKARLQPGPVVARPRGSVLMQVALVDPGRDQRVTLQSTDWRSSAEDTRM